MDILVVGGGIGGLTAALALARDGHSGVRRLFTGDQPVCSGFVAYRGTAGVHEVTARSRLDEVVGWIGPDLHFVQYPLRAGQIYNQVAVFRSPKYAASPHLADGQWGGPDELDEAFAACCPLVHLTAFSACPGRGENDWSARWPGSYTRGMTAMVRLLLTAPR